MKIAFIVWAFPSLSETFILNQITGLIDLGHEVDIYSRAASSKGKVHPDVEKYKLYKHTYYLNDVPENRIKRTLKALKLLSINLHKNPLAIANSLNIFKYGRYALSLYLFYHVIPFLRKRYDVIHCHFGPNGSFGAYLKKIGIKGKLITTFHGYDMSSFILSHGKDVYKDLFKEGDLFMPISEHWKRKLIRLGCREEKMVVHHMGIDIEKFKFFERKPAKKVKILTLGRLVEKKGHRYAIKEIAQVVKSHKNIEYIIAGDGPLRNKLESLVLELGIKDYVKFLGAIHQGEAMKLYQQADIFVLASVTASNGDQEGIPVVLMEAQAMGLPVISTLHTGIIEVVVNGKSGFLVPERNVDALAEKLEYLILHPEVWPKMGRAGRKYVEEHYDIRKLNQRLVKIYEELLSGTS